MLGVMPSMSSSEEEVWNQSRIVADARQVGMRWDDLQTKLWTRMSRGQYAWTGIPRDAWLKMRAVAERMPAAHAFSGLTAAWLLGLDVPWCEPIEVTIGT